MDTPSPGQGSPVFLPASGQQSTAAPLPLPASVIDLNQSNSFSKQVSSVTGCLGSVRTAQRAGSCWEHSGSMARQGILQSKCLTLATLVTGSPQASLGPRTFSSGQAAGRPQSPEGSWEQQDGCKASTRVGLEVVKSKQGPGSWPPWKQRSPRGKPQGLRSSRPANLGFWSGDGMAPTLPVGQSQACAGFRGQPHVRKRSISGRVGNSCLSLFGSAHLHPTALQPTVCGWGSPVLGLSLPEGRSERGEGGPSVCGRGGSRGS